MAWENAAKVLQERFIKRFTSYIQNPVLCHTCNAAIEYKKRKYKFCSKSCSAKFNNLQRGNHTIETKLNISKSLKNRKITTNGTVYSDDALNNFHQAGQRKRNQYKLIYDLNPSTCNQCNATLPYKHRNRKTCSRICNIKASTSRKYQNGCRKLFLYKGITLESSWELIIAKYLDLLNIRWIRPSPLQWIDEKNKLRLYYPDFYLSDYNLYLDPKNPYCMKLDAIKMEYFKDKMKLIFGPLKEVIYRTILHTQKFH